MSEMSQTGEAQKGNMFYTKEGALRVVVLKAAIIVIASIFPIDLLALGSKKIAEKKTKKDKMVGKMLPRTITMLKW